MSTYATTEAAALALLQSYQSGAVFDASNSTQGDFSALDAKGTDYAAVLLQAGPSEMSVPAHRMIQQAHQIGITLFVKRKQGSDGDGAAYQALQTLADGVQAWFDTYPRLNNAVNVKRAAIVDRGEPRVRDGRPWVWTTLLLEALTETEPVLVETAR